MAKPNKYNIRAIRNELENCIRYKSWNKFRSIFEPLELELQTEVAKDQTRKNSQSSSPPLLCILLESIKGPFNNPPIDLFELILKACPISCESRTVSFYSNTNPLSIAIDRHASIALVELIFKYDETKELLYRTKKKTREQHPPILKVARHLQDSESHNYDELIRLLVEQDVTKQSLLIPSATKNKVALYYVSNNHISFLPLKLSSDGNRDICVEETMEFMLLQTQQAVEIQQGRWNPLVVKPESEANVSKETGEVGFFPSAGNVPLSSEEQMNANLRNDDDALEEANNKRAMRLLRAMVTCTHLLGSRKPLDLMQHLVYRTQDLTIVDDQGESLLHYICRATDTAVFLDCCLANDQWPTKRSLVQHLIAECPNILLQKNKDGDIPLHLAIRCCKPCELLKELCPPSYTDRVLRTLTKQNQLPLHLAIEYYLPNMHCISQLRNMYPEAVRIRDGKHRLFSYQLVPAIMYTHSSVGGGILSDQENYQQSRWETSRTRREFCHDLQLSFDLLRSAPEVLQHSK